LHKTVPSIAGLLVRPLPIAIKSRPGTSSCLNPLQARAHATQAPVSSGSSQARDRRQSSKCRLDIDSPAVGCTAGLRGRKGCSLLGLGWAGLGWASRPCDSGHFTLDVDISRLRAARKSKSRMRPRLRVVDGWPWKPCPVRPRLTCRRSGGSVTSRRMKQPSSDYGSPRTLASRDRSRRCCSFNSRTCELSSALAVPDSHAAA
jgi:hypothetical protein